MLVLVFGNFRRWKLNFINRFRYGNPTMPKNFLRNHLVIIFNNKILNIILLATTHPNKMTLLRGKTGRSWRWYMHPFLECICLAFIGERLSSLLSTLLIECLLEWLIFKPHTRNYKPYLTHPINQTWNPEPLVAPCMFTYLKSCVANLILVPNIVYSSVTLIFRKGTDVTAHKLVSYMYLLISPSKKWILII